MRYAILLLFLKIKKILMHKEEQKEMKAMKENMTHVEAKELLVNNNEAYII
jgi:hypothetical protein